MYRPQRPNLPFRGHDTRRKHYFKPHTSDQPFKFFDPPPFQSKMASPLDQAIDTNVFHLEWYACEMETRKIPRFYEKFVNEATMFYGVRETTSPVGSIFADRVAKVYEKVKQWYPDEDLDGLEDYISRQKKLSLKADLTQITEGISAVDAQEEKAKEAEAKEAEEAALEVDSEYKVFEITSPPASPDLPFTVEILSVTTNYRALTAKEEEKPFLLRFSEKSGRYEVTEPFCRHGGCHGQENPMHFHIDPANLGFVAWAPGSAFVHTQTWNYEKGLSGDFCNVQMVGSGGLEYLMEDMKERGIFPQKRACPKETVKPATGIENGGGPDTEASNTTTYDMKI
ncbi:MAG: hypothetical protein Q9219_000725 [cf. Caloplaca sp. 3 TL-2023]